MKKLEITNKNFNDAVKAISLSLSKDNARPILKKCKMEVDKEAVKFIALNGYFATVYTLKHNCENVDSFECLFDVFKVDVDKRQLHKITIEQTKDQTLFTYLDKNNNEIVRRFKDFGNEYINWQLIFEQNQPKEFVEINFDPNLLIKTLKGFASKTEKITLKINTQNSNTPMFVDSKNIYENDIKIRALALPLKTFKEGE